MSEGLNWLSIAGLVLVVMVFASIGQVIELHQSAQMANPKIQR